ncbi:hypothetical protein BDE02_12G097300 [Populus trichocarpa]|nr:hypothetical protein BDE02_12G097300 [Populus trichocarpa]
MLSMATHKSFSSACRAFVTISRPIWPRFWSRSMRFACPSRLAEAVYYHFEFNTSCQWRRFNNGNSYIRQ